MKNNMNFTALPFDNDAQISKPRVAAEEDPKQWPANRKMKWPLIAFGAAVLVLVVCVTVSLILKAPKYSPLEVSLHGVKFTEDGQILEQGQVVISGVIGGGKFTVKQLSFAGESLAEPSKSFGIWNEQYTDRITFYLNRVTGFEGDVEVGIEGDWCVIRQNSTYIICTAAENGDVKAVAASSNIIPAALKNALHRLEQS